MIVNLNKDLHKDKILKEISQFIFLSVILIDSLFGTSKNLHLRVLLEKCENKENEMPGYITGDREISFDSDRKDSTEKKTSEENSSEEIFTDQN